MKKFLKEFKEFITRGNVLDMAVGIIIGGAFTAIITALVENILTPLINWIPGADGTSALQIVLRPESVDEAGVVKDALIIDFGVVISAIVTFLITAIVLFVIVKTINAVHKKSEKLKEELLKKAESKKEEEPKEEAAAVEEAPAEAKESTDQILAEIRDLLKAQSVSAEIGKDDTKSE